MDIAHYWGFKPWEMDDVYTSEYLAMMQSLAQMSSN